MLYNCSARIEKDENGHPEPKGNCTEQGLIKFLLDKKCPAVQMLETKATPLSDGRDRLVASIPFNSKRKKASAAIILPENENNVRIFVKGAPEFMLDICTSFINESGSTQHLSESKKDEIKNEVIKENFARQAYRTLMIAYNDMSVSEFNRLKY